MTGQSAVQHLGARFIEAWNVHDMDAFALLFREDADFVNVYGITQAGRERIRAEHMAVHASVFRDSRLSASEMRVKLLSDTVACLQIHWNLIGIAGPDGASLPERKGILTLISVRTDGGWEIAVGQNTDTVAPPWAKV